MKKIGFLLSMACAFVLADTNADSNEVSKEDKLNKLANSDFLQALASSKVSGFAFGRYRFNSGNSLGQAYQWRTIANIESGRYAGWAIGSGLIYTTGAIAAGGPDPKDANIAGGLGGSRGERPSSANDIFGINSLYLSKEFGSKDSTYVKVDAGMIRMSNYFVDNTIDRAIGGEIKINTAGLSIGIAAYDQWVTDGLVLNLGTYRGSAVQNAAAGGHFDNDLYIAEIKNDPKRMGGFGFNVALGHSPELLDALAFVELGYYSKVLDFKVQNSLAALPKSYRLRGTRANTYFAHMENTAKDNGLLDRSQAQFRGVTNILVNVKSGGLKAKIGGLFSYGDGYAVGLKANGGMEFAGKFWFNGLTTAKEGFGLFGGGANKGADIHVVYANAHYSYKKFSGGLDIAYIGGNNYMPVIDKKVAKDIYGVANKNQSLLEVTPSISYKPIDRLTLSMFWGVMTLDQNFQHTGFEANYKF